MLEKDVMLYMIPAQHHYVSMLTWAFASCKEAEPLNPVAWISLVFINSSISGENLQTFQSPVDFL